MLDLEDSFQSFRRAFISESATDRQIRDMRVAFMAGASIVNEFFKLLGSGEMGNDVAMMNLHRLETKIAEFVDTTEALR